MGLTSRKTKHKSFTPFFIFPNINMPFRLKKIGVKTLADKLMYCTSPIMIHKITSSVDYNWWLNRLETQLIELTNPKSIKCTKLSCQQITNRHHKTFGTSVINSQMYLPCLILPKNKQTNRLLFYIATLLKSNIG